MNDLIEAIEIIIFTVGVLGWFYLIPYCIRKGWGDARNKTMKVCNQCFRDIDMVNKLVKKIEEEKQTTKPTAGSEGVE